MQALTSQLGMSGLPTLGLGRHIAETTFSCGSGVGALKSGDVFFQLPRTLAFLLGHPIIYSGTSPD